MDLDAPSPPKFTTGLANADFFNLSGIPNQAWKEIAAVCTLNVDFLVNEYEGVVYMSFPSYVIEDFVVRDGRYGGCIIQNEKDVFSGCLKGDDERPALVYEGALNRFLHTLRHSNFEAQMQEFLNQKKEALIFVGHAIGGQVATLAMLWLLAKREKVRHVSPFCITFGSPLVGDARLGEALGREDWSGKFCHVVSKYDIVPRMLLAPFRSIAKALNAIVPHWQAIMGIYSVAASHFSIQKACKILFKKVVQCMSTMAYSYRGESGYRSPYRPFGTYMFCSTNSAACIEDPEAVWKMFHFNMHNTEKESFVVGACVTEHLGYCQMLEHVTEHSLSNAVKVGNFISDSSFEMGTAMELEAIGVGAQNNGALLALREAGYLKSKRIMNIEKLNYQLSKNQSYMAELEWFKVTCKANGPGYYDVLKSLGERDKKDFPANMIRITLEIYWDDIIEKVKNHVLPSGFQFQNKWINAGTAYRRLVEPLDIADYYRLHKDHGSYLSNGTRPNRHKILEKWLNVKDQTRINGVTKARNDRTKFASLTEDSCFWAHVEEACKVLKVLQQEQDQQQAMNTQLKESLEKFEDYVWKMIKDRSISVEVFLEGSSFMKWWQQYTHLQFQSNHYLSEFMENEGWNLQV
ncbi:lipase-like PAD4 isoform X1 [Cryptomeria japonica]|uniref:lipase-like PAD4 isoform X1 n=1 Tax=Cryptomeria japonica TaxID=3369 RepID=UPI0027DA0661|nr:lipase-like PAD4 isoform X1 [Cryptomeria japonica]XP_057867960.2 lipase-like PAD4 isoform X1 [Cryptomeria japonica]XP_057867961.2 lipase-like PAD4 isoform X1 [Cryptomeria japonica]XP_057867962.2 lipase-like PAD4 isoform X1 [Cryptomeria japonica]XP_057867963.2 lipase-like PAD4 isoform X1 [Cryptomeria japonica]